MLHSTVTKRNTGAIQSYQPRQGQKANQKVFFTALDTALKLRLLLGIICASLFKFPIKQCNPPGEISLIYIHMQIQKENRHSFKEKKKRRKGKSLAYHHSTDVETKCVGLSVSSLRLSRAKLQRWPV